MLDKSNSPHASNQQNDYVFTSESVSDGHPDKICDQISDAILDSFIADEPQARTAIEVMATTNKIVIAGEVRTEEAYKKDKIEAIARNVVKEIGYEQEGFHWRNLDVEVLLHEQSPDIAQGVDASATKDEGAGDQGLMFGYACNETENFMPAAIDYSHKILRSLSEARRAGELPLLGPDAKTQVSLRYHEGKPVHCEAVLVSSQHRANTSQEDIRNIIRPFVEKALPDDWISDNTSFLTNPTGEFVIGGPDGDCGLTGRKIIVDTYGGSAPHGGGAFSGKDPTKVDRSGAYVARYLAKNVVAAGLADKCLIQIAYAIGVTDPVSFYVNLGGKQQANHTALVSKLRELVSLTPRGIRTHLQLNRPIYQKTASFGHFGRQAKDGFFPWEALDLVNELQTLKTS